MYIILENLPIDGEFITMVDGLSKRVKYSDGYKLDKCHSCSLLRDCTQTQHPGCNDSVYKSFTIVDSGIIPEDDRKPIMQLNPIYGLILNNEYVEITYKEKAYTIIPSKRLGILQMLNNNSCIILDNFTNKPIIRICFIDNKEKDNFANTYKEWLTSLKNNKQTIDI